MGGNAMTIPDHRLYLRETDLRTAEDARNFLAKWRDSHNDWLEFGDAIDMLNERLERERWQACERGAEECERRAREICPDGNYTRGPSTVAMQLMSLALAFRAAARAR